MFNYKLWGLEGGIIGCFIITSMVINGATGWFDAFYTFAIQSFRSPFMNVVMEGITYIGNWQSITIICLLLLAFDKTRKTYGIPVTIAAVLSTVANKIMKEMVARPRPDASNMLIEADGFSYASGHTVTAVAVFCLLAYLLYKNEENIKAYIGAAALVILSQLIGLSRVYLGVHYPSDVMGGLFFGIAIFSLVGMIFYPYKKEKLKYEAKQKAKYEEKMRNMQALDAVVVDEEGTVLMENEKKVEPTLVVMAAGMGSRYGGLKQIDPITDKGEIILDFSLFDAYQAGFKRVVFVIKEENLEAFKELVDTKAGKHMEVLYAFQKLDDMPEGYEIPEGRVKPWGTGHAIMAARNFIDGPFAVINADDYYGPKAFKTIYEFLSNVEKEGQFTMVSYLLKNTITENGHVARGVCSVDEEGYLADIVERTKIMRVDGDICFTEDEETWTPLDEETLVSMNFWGYTGEMMDELMMRFPAFLDDAMANNPEKGEYMIPVVTDQLIKEGKATCKVLVSEDKWYGVTYKEDKQGVMDALKALKEEGKYPEVLWG